MHFIYIICSQKTNKFYIGETPDVEMRLAFHNDPNKNTNSTKSGIPWEIFWTMEVASRSLALKMEGHIKRMKSRKYLEDLKRHPAIASKLIERYSEDLG